MLTAWNDVGTTELLLLCRAKLCCATRRSGRLCYMLIESIGQDCNLDVPRVDQSPWVIVPLRSHWSRMECGSRHWWCSNHDRSIKPETAIRPLEATDYGPFPMLHTLLPVESIERGYCKTIGDLATLYSLGWSKHHIGAWNEDYDSFYENLQLWRHKGECWEPWKVAPSSSALMKYRVSTSYQLTGAYTLRLVRLVKTDPQMYVDMTCCLPSFLGLREG